MRDLVAALPELRHTVLVGRDSDVGLARRQLPTAEVGVLPSLHRAISPAADAAILAELVTRLRSGDWALAVSHQSKAGTLLRAASIVARDVPVVHSLSMASFGPGYGRGADLLFRTVERILARRTTRYVAVGEQLIERYTALGIDRDRFRVVRSGARLPTTGLAKGTARRQLRLPSDAPVVAYIGSLDERKGVTELPDLLARIERPRAASRPHLLVAGDGPQADQLRSGAWRRGLSERVHLLGYVDDVSPVLAAADVLVLLSRAEGLPQVLLQAAACGLPFVAYDVDGTSELLDLGAVGRVVPLGAVDEAAGAVADVLEHGRGEPTIDLATWQPEAIRAGYRMAVADVTEAVVAGDRRSREPLGAGRDLPTSGVAA